MLLNSAFRLTVAKLSVSTLIAWGVLYYAFTAHLPAMHSDLGWSTATLAAGFSIGLLVSGVLSPFVGARIDRIGSRSTMTGGVLAGAAGLLLWSVASNLAVYFAGWVLIGAGMSATLYEPAFATIVRTDPKKSRNGILLVSVVGALAATAFLPLSAFLIEELGWRRSLWALAAIFAATSLPLNLSLPATKERTTNDSPRPESPPPLASQPARPPSLRGFTAALMLANAAGVAFNAYIVVFLVTSGQTTQAAAFTAGTAGFAKIAGRLAGATATHGSPLRFLRATLVTQALSVLPAVLWPSTATMLGMVLTFGACSGARTVLRPAVVLELVGPGKFGQKNGVVQFVSTFAKSAAPLGFGLLLHVADLPVAWIALAALMFASALILPRTRALTGESGGRSTCAEAAL